MPPRLPSDVRVPRSIALPLLLAFLGLTAPGLAGQSLVRGELEGTVQAADGRPLEGVAVTVTELGSGSGVDAETVRGGGYRVLFLRMGEYEVLIEAPGFLPRLYRGVSVFPGETVRLSAVLEPAAPPVTSRDTVFVGAAGRGRYDGEAGRRISRSEIAASPERRMGIGGVIALAPLLDEVLGSEGLPGSLTGLILDGLPFTPASHPLQHGGSGDLPLLPRLALESVEVHRGTDIEWTGAAGSYVSIMTRPATGEAGGELFAAGTGGPLWQAAPFSGRPEPGMMSGWGGGAAQVPLGGEASNLFVAMEGTSLRTPRPSPLSDGLAARLMDVRPPGDGIAAGDLADPWLDDLKALSGLTRLDWRADGGAEVMARASFATVRGEGGRFFAPTLAYGSAAPLEGSDASGAVSVLAEVHPQVVLELRGGLQRSAREWRGTERTGGNPPLPTTRFTDAGALLGPDPGLAGEVSRTAFLGGATAHFRREGHRVKGGLSVSVPSFRYRYVHRSQGEFVFGSPERIATADGLFLRAVGPVPERTFAVPEIGVFIQHQWEPVPGIHLTTGLRYDRESLPRDRVPPNARWTELTELRNDALPSSLGKVSPRVAVSWDLAGDGATLLRATAGTHYDGFDPGALNEVLALSGPIRILRQVGDLDAWPALPTAPQGGPEPGITLALPGPDLDAPQTARASIGLSQRLGEASVLHVSGTLRRTRFLLRRSDLNLALQPSGLGAGGRPAHGVPVKSGSVMAVAPGTNRRFPEFDHVWALNADGWSEYRGATIAFEHRPRDRWELFAGYTFSVTEDNLVGAASATPDAQLPPRLPDDDGRDWEAAPSDFDVPHRLTAGVQASLPLLEGAGVSGVYRYRSARPFTAGHRPGVDVSGDGSGHNDPAFVDDLGAGTLACVGPDLGRIARRNACRGAGVHSLDLHLSLNVLRFGASTATLTLDLFNLLDTELGSPDPALVLVDDGAPLGHDPVSGEITIPFRTNPEFGEVLHPVRPGRLVRIGFRVALP